MPEQMRSPHPLEDEADINSIGMVQSPLDNMQFVGGQNERENIRQPQHLW
jgi:predicted RNase H-like HicB family nuclease